MNYLNPELRISSCLGQRIDIKQKTMAIYKYVSPERADILKNAHIRFTQPATFNDPFECFPYFKAIATEASLDGYLQSHRWNEEEIEKMLQESWENELQEYPGVNVPFDLIKSCLKAEMEKSKPLIVDLLKESMTMRHPFFRKMSLNALIRAMNREIGILCLTEKEDNLLMWAHYSSNHAGFVIQFDENHAFFDQRKEPNEIRGHLRKVRYSLNRPEVTLFDPAINNENINKWVADVFGVKSLHWEYEQEWRMFYTLRDCKKIISSKPYDIYLFSIPKNCITGIIWGCKISNVDKQNMLKIIRDDKEYSHVNLIQAEMDEREYRLKFIDL